MANREISHSSWIGAEKIKFILWLSIYLTNYLSIYLSICLSVYLSIYLSLPLSLSLTCLVIHFPLIFFDKIKNDWLDFFLSLFIHIYLFIIIYLSIFFSHFLYFFLFLFMHEIRPWLSILNIFCLPLVCQFVIPLWGKIWLFSCYLR